MTKSDELFTFVKQLKARKAALEQGEVDGLLDLDLDFLRNDVEALQSRKEELTKLIGDGQKLAHDSLLLSRVFIVATNLCSELRDSRRELVENDSNEEAVKLLGRQEELTLGVLRLELILEEKRSSGTFIEPTLEKVLDVLEPGYLLGQRYKVESVLDVDGTGAVYLVEDQRTPQKWAVKELGRSKNRSLDAQVLERYETRVRALSGLRHSALPRIVDNFESHSMYYVVMDQVTGQALSKLVSESGPLPQELCAQAFTALCGFLSFLHTQPVPIYIGDLKPSQVIFEPQGIRVVGFGLSRFFTDDTTLANAQSDIRSLAKITYLMYTGKSLDDEQSTSGADDSAPLSLAEQTLLRAFKDDSSYRTIEHFFQAFSQACQPPAVPPVIQESPLEDASNQEKPGFGKTGPGGQDDSEERRKPSGLRSLYKRVTRAVKDVYTSRESQ